MNSDFGFVDFNCDNDFNMGFGVNIPGRRGMIPSFGRGGGRSYNLNSRNFMPDGFGDFGSRSMNNMNCELGANDGYMHMRNIQQQMQMDMEEFNTMEFDGSPMNPMMMSMRGNCQVTAFGRGGMRKTNFGNLGRGSTGRGASQIGHQSFGIKKPAITSIRGRKQLEGKKDTNNSKIDTENGKIETETSPSEVRMEITKGDKKPTSNNNFKEENKEPSEASTSNQGLKPDGTVIISKPEELEPLSRNRARLYQQGRSEDNLCPNSACKRENLVQDIEHLFCSCYKVRAAWQWTKFKMMELLRDEGRPPDIRNIDCILAMFPKCSQEVECTLLLILGTFVELVDKEAVLKQKDLLVNTVKGVLSNKLECMQRRAVPQVHLPLP